MVFYMVIAALKTPEQPLTSVNNLLLIAFFLQGFSSDAINQVVPGGWSIAIEMCFYLFFPLIVRATKEVNARIFLAFVVYVFFTIFSTWFNAHTRGEQSTFIYFSLLTQLPVFLVGMAIYDTAIAEKLKVPWLLVGVCGIWAVFSIVAGRLGMLARPGFWLPVFILAAAVAVLASRWNNFWLEWVGQKSYSVYLFHFAVVELVGALFGDFARSGPLGFLMALFISISGALAVGSFSARYLEASSGRLGLNLLNRLSRGSEK
jgi:peptidoglycan/LPS O-acetylase OafA/YrhL